MKYTLLFIAIHAAPFLVLPIVHRPSSIAHRPSLTGNPPTPQAAVRMAATPIQMDDALLWYAQADTHLRRIYRMQLDVLDGVDNLCVYVTPGSSVYHTPDCRYRTDKAVPMVLKTLDDSYRPCKVCGKEIDHRQ